SVAWMPPHSEPIVSRICGALFRGSLIGGGHQEDVVCISATNIGIRATVINNISMRTGVFKKKFAVLNSWKLPNSHLIPSHPMPACGRTD
ncbi:hypothetical protein, partial [Xanthomonas axonopodis]|uniref:hypothetical protein n=1 Tax=Xanthomonas axonopodis TaxID=53413 RepID=UPI001071CEBA